MTQGRGFRFKANLERLKETFRLPSRRPSPPPPRDLQIPQPRLPDPPRPDPPPGVRR